MRRYLVEYRERRFPVEAEVHNGIIAVKLRYERRGVEPVCGV